MNHTREEMKKRSHSFNAAVSGKDLPLKENINIRKSRNNSYFKEKYIPLGNVYTSICKKFYPLIITDYRKVIQKCNNHFKAFAFYCFTCETHFCLECQSEHVGHSFISFDEIKINEKDIISEENLV